MAGIKTLHVLRVCIFEVAELNKQEATEKFSLFWDSWSLLLHYRRKFIAVPILKSEKVPWRRECKWLKKQADNTKFKERRSRNVMPLYELRYIPYPYKIFKMTDLINSQPLPIS